MKDKLIYRAAAKYRKWVLSQEFRQIRERQSFVVSGISDTLAKADQMKKWAERFFSGSMRRFQQSKWDVNRLHERLILPKAYEKIATTMIPDLELDAITRLKQAVAMLKQVVEKNTIIVPSPKEAMDEVGAIVEAWPEVKFRDNILSVKTEAITLEDDNEEVYLGSFWIHLNLTRPLDKVCIKSIENITSKGGFCHPHVGANEKLCIGEGDLPSQEALCQGRLEDYFRVIEAVLKTYNSSGPYEALKKWYDPNHDDEFFCESCDEWRNDDASCHCEGCEYQYCDNCDAGGGCCAGCSEWRCEGCSTECHGCGEMLCNGCSQKCYGCENVHCPSCLSGCAVCENQHCSECKESCAHCGDSMCEACTSTCGCCEDNHCDPCVDETCEECSKEICKGCETFCDECKKPLCTHCEENKCEDCGVSMCETCETEHNCLLAEVESSTPA